jgi:hypothetical protein
MPSKDDDRRVEEIQKWFDERGYDLYVHEVEGHGWRAPYMPKGSRIGSANYGTGDSSREAAEDAQARYTRDHEVDVSVTASMPVESTRGVSKQIGIAVETDMAMPITPAKSRAIEPAIDLPELDEKVETLTTYGWRVLFEEEPDGKVTGYLVDLDSGETLKSAMGDDFPDAWLGLGIDTTPPSMELRREGDHRREGPPDSND